MSGADAANLEDLQDVEAAVIEARQALMRAMSGLGGRADRERFAFHVGMARGRLERVSRRIYEAGESVVEKP